MRKTQLQSRRSPCTRQENGGPGKRSSLLVKEEISFLQCSNFCKMVTEIDPREANDEQTFEKGKDLSKDFASQ